MAESKDQKAANEPKQISRSDRLHFIGFDVFPGEGKELFTSEAEKEKYLNGIKERRSKGEIIRDACTLLGDRISMAERIILATAAVLIIGSMFLPWYSVYNEIEEDLQVEAEVLQDENSPADSLALAGISDSAVVLSDANQDQDTGTATTLDESALADNTPTEITKNASSSVNADEAGVTGAGIRGNEQIITSQQFKKSYRRVHAEIYGFQAFTKIGSLSSHVFSGGIIVVVSVLLMLVYALLCLLFPAYILYNVFGLKGDADEVALKLKKIFSYSWIPVLLFFGVMFLSFIGGSYGPTTVGTFTSLGDSYSIAVFLGTLSWGTFVSLVGFIIIAVKGVEI